MAKDSDEKTSIGSSLPPMPKFPAQKPVPPAAPADEARAAGGADEDRFGGTKVPQKSTLERLMDERTSLGQGPPPTPRKRVAEPAAPPIPSFGGAAAPADDDRTVVARHTPKAKARLQRVAPAGRSGVVSLTRTSYVFGRSNTAEIPLFSTSASRQHGKITNVEGKWFIEPLEGKTIKADGSAITGVTRLLHKMHLQLGEDELIFLDETAPAAPERTASTTVKAPNEDGPSLMRILVIAGVLVFLGYFVMFVLGG